MTDISIENHSSWLNQSLDALDVLRDSTTDGYLISEQMQVDGQLRGDNLLLAGVDLVRGFAHYFENNLDAASESFVRLVDYFSAHEEVDGAFFANAGIAIVCRKRGQIQQSHELCTLKLVPYIDLVLPRLSILGLNISAINLQELGRSEQAICFFYRALDVAQRIDSQSRIAQITANLGEVLYVTGNAIAAEELLQAARDAARLSHERWLQPFNSTMLALCKIALEKHEEAYAEIAQYLDSFEGETQSTNTYRSFYLSVAAYTLTLRGEIEAACRFNSSAIALMEQLEDVHLRPYIWWVSGFLNRRLGLNDAAIIDFKRAIGEIGDSGYIHLPLRAISELSDLFAELGRWQEAFTEQKRYQTIFAKVHDRASKVQVEYLKMRNAYKEAEQDRRLSERMQIERKSLDDELQRMLTERETILENSIVGMIFLNSQGRVQWVNTPLCQMFGVAREDVLGSSIEPFYNSREHYLECGAEVAQAVLRGQTFETELQMRRSDGSSFWVQFSGRAVNKKDLTYGTVWVVMDISARRQLEDDLHKSEYNYRVLINNVTEGIIVVQNGCIAFANKLIQTLTGFGQEELLGMPFTSPILPDDVPLVVERHRRRLRGENVEQYYQIRLKHRASNVIVCVEISSVLIEWAGAPATLTFVSDLTQRKLLEHQLKESMDERMRLQTLQMQNELHVSELARRHAEDTTEAKSLFLANMSHEIRTPMNAVIGMAHLALKTELTAKQKDYLGKIHKAGMSLMGIINDILDFSKIEAGKLDIEEVEFDLDEVFNSVAVVTSEKAEEKGLEYLFDVKMEVPKRLKGDPLRLGQVLINLVNNAIKFTERGEVCLRCEVIQRSNDIVTLQFEVSDTGLGMSDVQSSRLFMPFSQGDESTTRKFGGTGLGLSISQGMVNLMGGEISLKSYLGVGTTVVFTLSFSVVESEIPRLKHPFFEQLKVLIVDDHPVAAKLLAEKLETFGISCEVRHCAEQALSHIFEQDSVRQYDGLFIDLRMPQMDGKELTASIRSAELQLMPKIAIVGATARESLNFSEEPTIADAYLDKPFNASNVFDCLVNMFSFDTHPSVVKPGASLLSCRDLRILLVEDNIVNQQIASELLECIGVVVDVAANGKIAVERLLEVGAKFYDLVLMDVQMPEMDGHEATKLIRSHAIFALLPIVAMTAHALLIERERCMNSGMNAHIAKPIYPSELYQILLDWCPNKIVFSKESSGGSVSREDEYGMYIEGVDVRQGLKRTMGDHQLYLKLLRLFIQDQEHAVQTIRNALKVGDWLLAERTAHTLKGVSSLIGADIQLIAARLETMLHKKEEIEKINLLLSSCELQLKLTVSNIELCLIRENAVAELEGVTQEGLSISSEEVLNKIKRCYKLVSEYDGETLEALNESSEELCIAFGSDVQKQIMRAASQYDFDVILAIMKGNAQMLGLELE